MGLVSEEKDGVRSDESLEDFMIVVETKFTKAIDARFATMEARVNGCYNMLTELVGKLEAGEIALKEAMESAMENPLLKNMLSGGFGNFPGFGS